MPGGKIGHDGGGRPANEFRRKMRDVLESPEARKAFLAVITDSEHKQFATLWKSAAAYAYGKPPATLKIEREATPETGEQVMARLVHALPNLIAFVPDARLKMAEALANAENVLEGEFTVEADEDAS